MLCIAAAHGLSCPKGTYISYAFPSITMSFMRIAKVCMHAIIPMHLSEVCAFCVFSCHVQREHITDYMYASKDMHFPS